MFNMNYENKIWKKVTYPGIRKDYYLISEDGELMNILTLKKYKPSDHGGYYRYNLLKENETHATCHVFAHRLVAYEFVENPNNYPYIDHIDGVKNHNHYTNLDWVTPKENTRRAINLGLKSDVGYNHVSSIFTEELARSICEKLEQGYSIKDIYRWLKHDATAKPNDDYPLYQFIHRLKHRLGWDNITSEYNYSTKSDKRNGKWDKQPPGIGNNVYDEKMIREVCVYLEQGKSAQDILEIYTGSRYQRDNQKIYSFIDGIRRKLHWTEISCEYAIENSKTRSRSSGWDPIIAELVDKGFSNKEIFEYFNLTTKDNRNETEKIKRMIKRYKKFKTLKSSENIIIDEK